MSSGDNSEHPSIAAAEVGAAAELVAFPLVLLLLESLPDPHAPTAQHNAVDSAIRTKSRILTG